jgi:hypothetical protein
VLRERWSQLLDRRREYLNAQIQRYINKLDKTELECEREVSGGHGRVIITKILAYCCSNEFRQFGGFLSQKRFGRFLALFFCEIFPPSVSRFL